MWFKRLCIFFVAGLLSCSIFAQSDEINLGKKDNLPVFTLSKLDSIALVNLPELVQLTPFKFDLPYMVDNSKLPYFRPLFVQTSIECNQYSGIAFNFTYEMNYARNTPANVPENQYPTHYTFNFMNGGFGWEGVSYFYSWEVAKVNGHPNVLDYGGMSQGGPTMWITGYEKYYNGMFNKLDDMYQIRTSDEQGLLNLKHWLDNHMMGEDAGGIASFYSSSPWNATTLPPGTPEGGKHVISGFIGPAGHASTIVGYNDSIRFDYNGDGLYTIDVDINGDSLVNLKDWEIGGLKFTDSYIGGNTWADSGFCYMMYNTLARETDEGGIWNQSVHVVRVKNDYAPELTLKVKLTYNCREKIKVMAGISDNIETNEPSFTMDFPIFNYQGACRYMQGSNDSTELKTLEFGLDITPLLSNITPGSMSKIFLLIDENDPLGWGDGQVDEFSVMDYTQGSTEIPYPLQNIPLVQNGLTTLAVLANINFNKPEILTNNLPVAFTHEPYALQMEAQGGKEPYSWAIKKHINKSVIPADYPEITGAKYIFEDTVRSTAKQKLDFSFPFYGETYDSVYVHDDGFLVFDDQELPWGSIQDKGLMLRRNRIIAPYFNLWMQMDSLNNEGVWFDGNENAAAFFWKMSSDKLNFDTINFAAYLYPSGMMEFYYGPEDIFIQGYYVAGISNGDDLNYTLLHEDEYFPPSPDKKITLTPVDFPHELTIDDNGLLSGIPNQNYEGLNIDIVLTDDKNVTQTKAFEFYSYVAGLGDDIEDNYPVHCFPNPVNSILQLEFTLPERKNLSLHLINIVGEEILLQPRLAMSAGRHVKQYDLSSITSIKKGLYFLIGKCDIDVLFTQKIVYMGK